MEIISIDMEVNKTNAAYLKSCFLNPPKMSLPTNVVRAFPYYLTDPRNIKDIRYVGITENPLNRQTTHNTNASKNGPLRGWIQEIKMIGQNPVMMVIEQIIITQTFPVTEKREDRESHWIEFYLQQGKRLLNINY